MHLWLQYKTPHKGHTPQGCSQPMSELRGVLNKAQGYLKGNPKNKIKWLIKCNSCTTHSHILRATQTEPLFTYSLSLIHFSFFSLFMGVRYLLVSEGVSFCLFLLPYPSLGFLPNKTLSRLILLASASRTWLKTTTNNSSYPPSQLYFVCLAFPTLWPLLLIYLVDCISLLSLEWI